MSPPWMPFYPTDYLADTVHFTALEHGAYLLLILHYWRDGGLPEDEAKLRRIARLSEREWAKSREVIAEKFKDGWRHNRIDKELKTAVASYQKRAEAGRRGGLAKSSNATAGL